MPQMYRPRNCYCVALSAPPIALLISSAHRLNCDGLRINRSSAYPQARLCQRYLHAGSFGQPIVAYFFEYSKYAWIQST